MRNLSQSELRTLYINFVVYRDEHCDGAAKMGVEEFYKKYRLNPYSATTHRNIETIDAALAKEQGR